MRLASVSKWASPTTADGWALVCTPLSFGPGPSRNVRATRLGCGTVPAAAKPRRVCVCSCDLRDAGGGRGAALAVGEAPRPRGGVRLRDTHGGRRGGG
jgi:hypothetical protein